MWVKDFFPDSSIQSSEETDGKFLIAKRPITKIEPNSLRVHTKSCGIIQFRVPPNTIKHAHIKKEEISTYYVLTDETFYNGMNYIDIAFPIFENYFLYKQRKTVFPHDPCGRTVTTGKGISKF